MTHGTNNATVGPSGDGVLHPLGRLDRSLTDDDQFSDLEWLDEAIDGARVVAIGENSHGNGEFYRLRHRLLRYLVERHGFTALAWESGFVEGWQVNDWVQGDAPPEALGDVLANGMTSLMGMWVEMRELLDWLRRHNQEATSPVSFFGIDPPGSNLSLLPGLDHVRDYLAIADPEFVIDPALRATAASFAAISNFDVTDALRAYADLPVDRKDALTAGLAVLAARLRTMRPEYVQRTSAAAYEQALHTLALTTAEDAAARDRTVNVRDLAQADTVEWMLTREQRIVLAAHDGHVHRWPIEFPGAIPKITSLGQHLAARLGEDYLVIGTTVGHGQTLTAGEGFFAGRFFDDLADPDPGTLDALMAAWHSGEPFAVDLRRLTGEHRDQLDAISHQRLGSFTCPVDPQVAYDLVIHLPEVTAAEPDPQAITCAPSNVQTAFNTWLSDRSRLGHPSRSRSGPPPG